MIILLSKLHTQMHVQINTISYIMQTSTRNIHPHTHTNSITHTLFLTHSHTHTIKLPQQEAEEEEEDEEPAPRAPAVEDDSESAVITLTDSNFKESVTDSTADLMLEFYGTYDTVFARHSCGDL